MEGPLVAHSWPRSAIRRPSADPKSDIWSRKRLIPVVANVLV